MLGQYGEPRRALLRRAFSDTVWFKAKADIFPGLVAGAIGAIVTYGLRHGSEGFRMSEITIPFLVVVVSVVGYWVVVNTGEFVWNLTQAGNRLTIERLTRELESRPAYDGADARCRLTAHAVLETQPVEDDPNSGWVHFVVELTGEASDRVRVDVFGTNGNLVDEDWRKEVITPWPVTWRLLPADPQIREAWREVIGRGHVNLARFRSTRSLRLTNIERPPDFAFNVGFRDEAEPIELFVKVSSGKSGVLLTKVVLQGGATAGVTSETIN